MAPNYFKSLSLRKVLISRGRADKIVSHEIFPDATLVVPESEEEDYAYLDMETVTTPDDVKGLGPLRNWVLDNFDEEIIVMIDDDVKVMRVTCRERGYKVDDPEIIDGVIESTARCAKDIGTGVFGFHQTGDVRKYQAHRPFKLVGWVGGVIGVVGREIRFEDNMFKVDVDFCLENLLHNRVIWKENRFGFVQKRDTNAGGNSLFRTEEKVKSELRFLKNKWKGHFDFKELKTGSTTSVKVNRKQSLQL